jgi:hypothetical protein
MLTELLPIRSMMLSTNHNQATNFATAPVTNRGASSVLLENEPPAARPSTQGYFKLAIS